MVIYMKALVIISGADDRALVGLMSALWRRL
ncbi:hypothetical protein J2747_002119 [Thermococcus stetteri]|nr:hypothetical protein [Thermococcus stetteri]